MSDAKTKPLKQYTLNNILPSQVGESGKFLATDGNEASWVAGDGAGTVTSVATGTGLSGGPITTTGTVSLANTAVTPGAYTIANITVDAQGRITSAANGTAGSVSSVATGTGLSGGPITSTGTVSLADTAVTPGSYTSADITVDAQGRITSAASGAASGANDSLSNLTSPTAVNQDLIPSGSKNMGSASTRWNAINANDYEAYGDAGYNFNPANTNNYGQLVWDSGENALLLKTRDFGGGSGPGVKITSASSSTGDATATGTILVQTGNKTAGTGDSGSIDLTTGTSSGGTRGSINLDGSIALMGSELHTAIRAASNPDTLSASTDRSILVDTSVGVDPFVLNLPPGVDGLEYWIKDSGNNASSNNIQVVVNGLDTMDPLFQAAILNNNSQSNHYLFFNGVWWVLSRSF